MYPLEGETDMAAEAPQLSDAVHLLESARFDIYSSWGCVEQPHDVFLHAWLKIEGAILQLLHLIDVFN